MVENNDNKKPELEKEIKKIIIKVLSSQIILHGAEKYNNIIKQKDKEFNNVINNIKTEIERKNLDVNFEEIKDQIGNYVLEYCEIAADPNRGIEEANKLEFPLGKPEEGAGPSKPEEGAGKETGEKPEEGAGPSKPGEGARPRPEPITPKAVKTKWCECGEWAYHPNQYEAVYKWTDPKTGIEYYYLLCPEGHDVVVSAPEYEIKRMLAKWPSKLEELKNKQQQVKDAAKSLMKNMPLRIWSWDFSYIIPLLAIPVVGAIVAAITGSMLFLFASIFGALYAIIPSPEETYKRRLEAIKKAVEKAKEIEELKKLKFEAFVVTECVKIEKEATHYHALAWPKLLLKFSALLCLSLAFIFSNIPLAPLIGLIVALILYFALG